jgi:Ca2+-binding RTX toxin-like protein
MAVLIGGPLRDILTGGTGNDVLVGLREVDQLSGQGGQDTLMGNQDEDVLNGGVGNDILSGGDGNDVLTGDLDDDALNGETGTDDMRGGPGNDRYVVDNDKDIVDEGDSINADPADLVGSFIDQYKLPSRVENLTLLGSVANVGWGNDNRNRIVGNANDNFLVGRQELDFSGMHRDDADTLIGQDGNDKYIVDSEGDRVIEAPNQGVDLVVTDTPFYLLPDNVENLLLVGKFVPLQLTSGFGNKLDNEISGSLGNNWLFGLAGNDTMNGGSGGTDSLFGGDGNDQYVVYDPTKDIVRESNPDGSITDGLDEVISFAGEYTLPAQVENLVLGERLSTVLNGSGNDEANFIQGNEFDNSLHGGNNDDTLTGGQGNDTLNGDAGDDTYLFHLGDGVDQVEGNDLFDTIRFDDAIAPDQVAFFTTPFQQLEIGYTSNTTDLITTQVLAYGSLVGKFELQNGLFMNSADVTRLQSILYYYAAAHGIPFNTLNDVKSNFDLRDIIANSWRVGPDIAFTPFVPIPPPVIAPQPGSSLNGTFLGDILIGGRATNAINAEGGDDYVMGMDGIDILSGGSGNDILSGGSGNDFMFGESGNDILNGGPGIDYMEGGADDDFYMVSNPRDIVVEQPNGGRDTIVSQVSYSLPSTLVPGSSARTWNVEVLRLIGNGNISATGSPVNDELIGNDGDNTLNGGAGVDILVGGKGNDTFFVDNPLDFVSESANEGDADRVNSTVDYTLVSDVEILSLEGFENITGTGNKLANIMYGNSGNNILTGGDGNDILYGSPGDDALDGGMGNDRYAVFDDSGDIVRELPGEGVDEIKAYVSWALTPNVENLVLGVPIDGPIDFNGFGNAENNYMEGNRGNNTLDGGIGNDYIVGAQGDDTLQGGEGNDTYLFRLGDGLDIVDDSSGENDTMRFNNSIPQNSILFFRNPLNPQARLQIGYLDSADWILVNNQNETATSIEKFELENGLYMDAEDVNRVIAAMTQYARQNHLEFNSLADVANNPDLMSIVHSGWHI